MYNPVRKGDNHGTPRHVKDVHTLQGADATNCSVTSSEDEAPMLYLPQQLKATTATVVNMGPETRPRTKTLPRAFRSDEVAD